MSTMRKLQRRRPRRRSQGPKYYLVGLIASVVTVFMLRQMKSASEVTRRHLAAVGETPRLWAPDDAPIIYHRLSNTQKSMVAGFSKVFAAISDYTIPSSTVNEGVILDHTTISTSVKDADNDSVPTIENPSNSSSSNNNNNNNNNGESKHTPQENDEEKSSRMTKYKDTYKYAPPSNIATAWQPAPECGIRPDFTEFFKLSFHERSRYDEDQQIYQRFFRDKLLQQNSNNNGILNYVEIGAFDGVQESNSRFFDVCLGWKGLLIEGNPTSFQRLNETRPHTHRMSFAPSCSAEYEAINKTVQFAKYPMTNAGLKGVAKTYDLKPQENVACAPLGGVLEDIFQGEPISFFSLDVEGAEPQVLQTIDFQRVKIDVLMVEVENNFCRKTKFCKSRTETREIMSNAGYIRYEGLVCASDVYVRPDSEFALPEDAALLSESNVQKVIA